MVMLSQHVDDRREVKAALNAWVSDALIMGFGRAHDGVTS